MDVGIVMFPTAEAIGPAELARAVEERGFAALMFPEHTHIPAIRATPAPAGGPLPDYYARTLDPFVALTAAATATQRIRIGTAMCLLAQRDAIVTAKAAATLDQVSGGRLTFGVGYGWNREEIEDHGVPYGQRREIVGEKMRAVLRLWQDEEATFSGEHVSFERAWAWPKPIQQPHPPIILGGAAGPRTFAHAVEFADMWMPIAGRGRPFEESIPMLRAACEAAGRDPGSIRIGVFAGKPDELERYRDLGLSLVLLAVAPAPRDDALRALDALPR